MDSCWWTGSSHEGAETYSTQVHDVWHCQGELKDPYLWLSFKKTEVEVYLCSLDTFCDSVCWTFINVMLKHLMSKFIFGCFSWTDAALCGRESPENIGFFLCRNSRRCCTSQSVMTATHGQNVKHILSELDRWILVEHSRTWSVKYSVWNHLEAHSFSWSWF